MFGFKPGMLPKTEFVEEHKVTMPLHPLMNEDDVEYIINHIGEVI